VIRAPSRRVAWLLAAAGVLAAANVADHLFFGEKPAAAKKKAASAPLAKAAPQQSQPSAAPARAPLSRDELRQRIEQMRSLAHASREVHEAYAKVALPYAEAMAPLATWFPPGSEPKAVLERAVRQLATDNGLDIEALAVATPRRVGDGVYQGVATVSLRGGDSGGMLRFLSEAGRPGGGMVWNGFQLSADAQKKQLALAGELHVLLIEAAE